MLRGHGFIATDGDLSGTHCGSLPGGSARVLSLGKAVTTRQLTDTMRGRGKEYAIVFLFLSLHAQLGTELLTLITIILLTPKI